jgi:hypothetical protein
MPAFSLFISGNIDVSKYVDASSLEEYSQKIEGDGMWDYRLDDLSVSLDKSFLDDFSVKTTELYRIRKWNAYLEYYGKKVFDGVIEEAEYDFNNETVDLGIWGWGKVIADFPVSFIQAQGEQEDITVGYGDGELNSIISVGESPLNIANKLVKGKSVGSWFTLRRLDSPIKQGIISGSYSHSPNYKIDMDVKDFPAFKSLVVEDFDTTVLSFEIFDSWKSLLGIYKCIDSDHANYGRYFGRWWASGTDTLNDDYILELKSDGFVDPTNLLLIDDLILNYERAEDEFSSAITTQFERYHNLSNPTYKGKVEFGNDVYWLSAGQFLTKITISDEDRFWYRYENEDVATIQKDIAILTNSLTWIQDQIIYFRKRNPTQIFQNKKVLECNYEMIIKNEDLPLTDSVTKYLADNVLAEIDDFYNKYMAGTFHKYSLVMDKDEFDEDDYPLIAKNLEIILDGEKEKVGTIKEVTYKEDVIELTTELKVE